MNTYSPSCYCCGIEKSLHKQMNTVVFHLRVTPWFLLLLAHRLCLIVWIVWSLFPGGFLLCVNILRNRESNHHRESKRNEKGWWLKHFEKCSLVERPNQIENTRSYYRLFDMIKLKAGTGFYINRLSETIAFLS